MPYLMWNNWMEKNRKAIRGKECRLEDFVIGPKRTCLVFDMVFFPCFF